MFLLECGCVADRLSPFPSAIIAGDEELDSMAVFLLLIRFQEGDPFLCLVAKSTNDRPHSNVSNRVLTRKRYDFSRCNAPGDRRIRMV